MNQQSMLWNNSLIFLVYSPLKDILTIAEGKGSLTIEEKLVDFLEESVVPGIAF